MKTLVIGLSILAILFIMWRSTSRVEITVNNRNWSVCSAYDNSREAADLLNRTNEKIIKFLRFLKHRYHVDETDDIIYHEGTAHHLITGTDAYRIAYSILHNYNPDMFYENDPRYSVDTSYTVNKGESMYICLRDKPNTTNLTDENTLLFVMLHEIAHIGNYNGWGHGNRFWTVFKFVLQEAVNSGVYKYVNYAIYPQEYCGLPNGGVTYQPLDDPTLPPIEGALGPRWVKPLE